MTMLMFVLLGIGAGVVDQARMLCCRLLEAMSRAGYELAASVDMSVGGGGMDSKSTSARSFLAQPFRARDQGYC